MDENYNDDRMFVLEISRVKTRSFNAYHDGDGGVRHGKESPWQWVWSVCARRNTPRYPPVRSTSFQTHEEALDYYKIAIVETPLLSLDGKAPSPVPSLDDYSQWLNAEGLFDPLLNPSSGNSE